MTLPSALLGLLIALFVGALFHVLVDGGPAKLVLYLILSCMGFGAGQWLATSLQWSFLPIGPLQTGIDVLGSVLALVVGNWLSQVNIERTGRARKV